MVEVARQLAARARLLLGGALAAGLVFAFASDPVIRLGAAVAGLTLVALVLTLKAITGLSDHTLTRA